MLRSGQSLAQKAMHMIPVIGRWKKENKKFKVILGDTV